MRIVAIIDELRYACVDQQLVVGARGTRVNDAMSSTKALSDHQMERRTHARGPIDYLLLIVLFRGRWLTNARGTEREGEIC